MEKVTVTTVNNPRTDTQRYAEISGINFSFPNSKMGSTSAGVSVNFDMVTLDKQGKTLLSESKSSGSNNAAFNPGVQPSTDRATLELELIELLTKSAPFKKLLSLDIKQIIENESKS